MQNSELRTRSSVSFTLIEMMAVVAIIMVMVGLIFPVIGYAKEQAKKAKAREEMNNLKIACRAFYNEYGYWPQTTTWSDFSSMLNGNVNPYSGAAGPSWALTNNIRSIRFMEFKTTSVSTNAEFIDPWGKPYIVLMDSGPGGAVGKAGWADGTREDGKVNNPGGGSDILAPIAVYSFGSDLADGSGADNTDDLKTWTN